MSLTCARAIRSGVAYQESMKDLAAIARSLHAEDRRIQLVPALALVQVFRHIDEREAVGHRPDLRIDREVVAVGQDLLAIGEEEVREQRGRVRARRVPYDARSGRQTDDRR